MKSITLHPSSVLAGLVLATLAFFATGAYQSQSPGRVRPSQGQERLFGQVPAQAWVFARVRVSTDSTGQLLAQENYTVPSDRYLVVTGEKEAHGFELGILRVNGALDGYTSAGLKGIEIYYGGSGYSIDTHGTRFILQPGTTLSFDTPNNANFELDLWGYLEPL